MRILIAEDDGPLASFIAKTFASEGHECEISPNGEVALQRLTVNSFDLLILDLGLPVVSGSEVLTEIRTHDQNLPILILTAVGHVSERVACLDAGADDYLTKPFGNQELLARVRALFRRSGARELPREFQCGSLTIDVTQHRIALAGKAIRLTKIGYALLQALALRQGNVVTHRQLIREVWGGLCNDSALHVLHVTISNLRRKIEPDPLRPEHILTEVGIGYRLAAPINMSKDAP